MNPTSKAALALALCVSIGFLVGASWMRGRSQHAVAGGPRILYYQDPMHPAYKSDKPGIAPDCGMQLEPVYADEGGQSPPEGPATPGAVRIGSDKQQLIGVRVEKVVRADMEHKVRLLGRVTADESRLYRIVAPGDGLVNDIGAATTGTLVDKDERLASYYSRDSVSLRDQLAYLSLATGGQPTTPIATNTPAGRTVYTDFARDSLRLLGMDDNQVQELDRTKQAMSTIRISSPVKGLILARNLYPGLRFEKGAELYRVADLSNVWVLADVFENDERLIQHATGAAVLYQDLRLPARTSPVLPQFDASTRTLKLRFDVSNPGLVLRPDMFVDVALNIEVRSVIAIPAGAVLDSGLRNTVFVDRGNGIFEPRQVQTGARLGDRVIITSGLEAGEAVVVSGNFLIDSESRLQQSAASMAATPAPAPVALEKDPVCGMELDPAQPRRARSSTGARPTISVRTPAGARLTSNRTKYAGEHKTSLRCRCGCPEVGTAQPQYPA